MILKTFRYKKKKKELWERIRLAEVGGNFFTKLNNFFKVLSIRIIMKWSIEEKEELIKGLTSHRKNPWSFLVMPIGYNEYLIELVSKDVETLQKIRSVK